MRLLIITYEPNLFHQAIQTKYLRLCLLNVAFKDSNLKKKKSEEVRPSIIKQKGGRKAEWGGKKNTPVTYDVLDLRGINIGILVKKVLKL